MIKKLLFLLIPGNNQSEKNDYKIIIFGPEAK